MAYNYNHNERSKLPGTNRGTNMSFKQTDSDTWTLVSNTNKKSSYRRDDDSTNHNDMYAFNSKRVRQDEYGKIIRSDKRDGHNSQYNQHNQHNQHSQYNQKDNQNDNHYDNSYRHQHNNQNDNDIDDNEKYKNDNYKKILCKNINSIGKCIYTNKCLYAHSIDEQNMEPIRVTAYDMIKKNDDLSHVDLTKNKQLYNNLLALSKVCQQCDEGTCTGGYNCKHGACDKIYVICQTDLNKGTCEGCCGKIHLTKKGLVPYGVNIVKNLKAKVVVPKATIINEEFFKRLSDSLSDPNNTFNNTLNNTTIHDDNKVDNKCGNKFYNKPTNSTLLSEENRIVLKSEDFKSNDSDVSNTNSNLDLNSSTNSLTNDESNTWATIVKNDSPSNYSIRVKHALPKQSLYNSSFCEVLHNNSVSDLSNTKNDDSMDSESSDDDIFTRLHSVGQNSDAHAFDMSFNREDKLTKSIFKIDIMCI